MTRSFHHADQEFRKMTAWLSSISSDLDYNVRKRGHLLLDLQRIHPSPLSAIVTGAMGGIGYELCKRLANNVVNNQSLILFSRKNKLAQLTTFATQLGRHVHPRTMNLDVDNQTIDDMLTTMMDHADELRNISTIHGQQSGRIDLLIHNAGLMNKHSSVQNIHAVNYYCPALLTLTLLPDMLAHSDHPVILFVGSSSHLRGSLPSSNNGPKGTTFSISRLFSLTKKSNPLAVISAYADSKLRLLLASTALERRLENTGCVVRTTHPGLVDTPMLQGYFTNMSFPWRRRFLRSPQEGAAAVLLPALTNFDVILYSPPLSTPTISNIYRSRIPTGQSWTSTSTHKDYRTSYYVNGKPSPMKCSELVNDLQACELCYQDCIREIRCANESVRTRFVSRIRQAGSIIDENGQLTAEMKIRRKQTLHALALDIDM